MANNRKPPGPPLSPDVTEARRHTENLERQIVFGAISSYQFYQSIKDIVAPWDPERRTHRMDFSIDRYNSLWRFIAAFYQRFAQSNLTKDVFIPAPVMANYVVDSANRNGIPITIAEKLVEEINEEKGFTESLTLESLKALAQSTAFSDWLTARVMEHTIGTINAHKSLGLLTLDSMETLMAKAKDSASMARSDCLVNGASFIRGTRRIMPKISIASQFPQLNAAIGGGFQWGDSSMIAGINAGGKCLGFNTLVMMHDGSVKPVQDIRVGELLMGPDRTPRTVLSLSRGREEMFRVIPADGGMEWTCNRSHIICVTARMSIVGGIKFKDFDTTMTVDHFLEHPDVWGSLVNMYREHSNGRSYTRFELRSEGEGNYYGFEIDGDRQFLLGDFTVTHNTVLITQLADVFVEAGYNVMVVTTERRPDELFMRSVSNRLGVDIGKLTATDNMAANEEAEVAYIPDFIWRDPAMASAMERMDVAYKQRLCYVDWSKGQGNNIKTHFESAVKQVEALGWIPQVTLFDWIGGGLDSLENKDWLRLYYQDAADHLINYNKRSNRIMLMAAQLDKSKVGPKTAYVDASMLSECKGMANNLTNFIGLTALRDGDLKGNSKTVINRYQQLCVGKATRGVTGTSIKVETCFQFQRIAELIEYKGPTGGGA